MNPIAAFHFADVRSRRYKGTGGAGFRDEWRRRESNPRPRTHRPSVYKHRLRLKFRPDGWFATNLPAG